LEEKINKPKERIYYLASKSIQINTNNIYFNKILRIISILLLLILVSNNLISTFYSRLLFDKSLSFYFFSLFLLNKIQNIRNKSLNNNIIINSFIKDIKIMFKFLMFINMIIESISFEKNIRYNS
jgi:hypothetical protein